YDRALTGAEIQGVYAAGSAGKCSPPNLLSLGTLPSGSSAHVSYTTMPTNCDNVSVAVAVSSSTTDPQPLNNSASVSVPVQNVPPNLGLISIERVSFNNDPLRLGCPIPCDPTSLKSTTNLLSPIIWDPVTAPVLLLPGGKSTILPASERQQYF